MSIKPNLAIILGSGFSCESELPSTKKLSSDFLKEPNGYENTGTLNEAISRILKKFWEDAFGYKEGDVQRPSLEDHFTMLDLAANSGHQLGKKYSPKKLRAIRRMSIHRVFQILDSRYNESEKAQRFLQKLHDRFCISIVTLNWDTVIEKILNDREIDYGIDIEWLEGPNLRTGEKVTLLKMHGSSNWMYCDSCRTIHAELGEKAALHRKAFLEPDDFHLFNLSDRDLDSIKREMSNATSDRECKRCGIKLAGRLATFSYTKAFSINQFQTIWERAHTALRAADTWIFVGYSMPQADYEFKHLLKSAQLGRKEPGQWKSEIILKRDCQAQEQYERFFGERNIKICQNGLSRWVETRLCSFVKEKGR